MLEGPAENHPDSTFPASFRKRDVDRATVFSTAALFVFLLLGGPLPNASGQSNSEPFDEEVTFVAYNLENYFVSAGSPESNAKPKPEASIRIQIDLIAGAKPDILGVCEIGGRAALTDLQARLKKAGVNLPHAELVVAADAERNLALLSRFPVAERRHQDSLTYVLGDARLPMQRGILDATVSLDNGRTLRFIGLHLKSKREVPEADQDLMRRNEAHLVRQHVDGIMASTPKVPILVYGDLNALKNEISVKSIQGKFRGPTYLKALLLDDSHGERWTHHWADADVYSRFDYVFSNSVLSPLIDTRRSHVLDHPQWKKSSDHRALVVKLQIPPPEPDVSPLPSGPSPPPGSNP